MSDPYQEGREAWEQGFSDTKNPYPEKTDDHLSWNDGYMSAQEEEEEE